MTTAKTIEEVISVLENIIKDSQKNNDPLGYFAALYLKVTQKVKEGISENFFDDGPRMEKLDVVFANRYLAAYFAHQKNQAATNSWQKSFEISSHYWPIVLQHVLMGMNAHINLDLGIAAAEISKAENIDDLQNDFNKINEILSSLVADVEKDLSRIWPTLKRLLKISGKVDDFLVDFSMKIAREGAWKFAKSIAHLPVDQLPVLIADRDRKVARKSKMVSNPGVMVSLIFKIVRLGEKGSVSDKIYQLK